VRHWLSECDANASIMWHPQNCKRPTLGACAPRNSLFRRCSRNPQPPLPEAGRRVDGQHVGRRHCAQQVDNERASVVIASRSRASPPDPGVPGASVGNRRQPRKRVARATVGLGRPRSYVAVLGLQRNILVCVVGQHQSRNDADHRTDTNVDANRDGRLKGREQPG